MSPKRVFSSPASDTHAEDAGLTPVKTRSSARRSSAGLSQRTPSLTDTPIPVLTPPAASPRSRAPQKVARPAHSSEDSPALRIRGAGVAKGTRTGRAGRAAASRVARAVAEEEGAADETHSANVEQAIAAEHAAEQGPVEADRDVESEELHAGSTHQTLGGKEEARADADVSMDSALLADDAADTSTGEAKTATAAAPHTDNVTERPGSAGATPSDDGATASKSTGSPGD